MFSTVLPALKSIKETRHCLTSSWILCILRPYIPTESKAVSYLVGHFVSSTPALLHEGRQSLTSIWILCVLHPGAPRFPTVSPPFTLRSSSLCPQRLVGNFSQFQRSMPVSFFLPAFVSEECACWLCMESRICRARIKLIGRARSHQALGSSSGTIHIET